ncbi:ATP-binding SpoIIE family protein phosphatase [Streptacidiphilus rugosus]|uniref:ATP-binding SpoIIE family protein phosphatase n=1 Tax=Streptacidiphilus rugosus TaxID=405783 RepID=UPI00068DB4FA|nr:SpoIIE family protein phosphatase [Streptacidiphilus rugosus]
MTDPVPQESGSPAERVGEAVLHALFTQSPTSLYVFDGELRLVRVNSAARFFREVADQELLGRSLRQILPVFDVADAGRLEQIARRVLETGQPVNGLRIRLRGRSDPPAEVLTSAALFRLHDEDGAVLGVCATLTDITAQVRAEEGLRLLNVAATRLGSTLDMFRIAAEFCDLAVPQFADSVVVDLYDSVLRGRAPAVDSAERGAAVRRAGLLSVTGGRAHDDPPVGELVTYPGDSPQHRALVTWTTHLLDDVDPAVSGARSVLAVPVRARGVVLGLACFLRRQNPLPFDQDDRRLAEQLTAHAALCLDNARLYARERSAARVMKGRGSHPDTPATVAVELAGSYRPAGDGGSWFDVIPLSSARVALVAGRTPLGSAAGPAAMCEVRAAVEALSDLDLPPEEILERLHDLAGGSRPDLADPGRRPGDAAGNDTEAATCLYLVYDPVTLTCTAASAGHPSPVLRFPDGTVEMLDVPSGPALGCGPPGFRAVRRTLPAATTVLIHNTPLSQTPTTQGTEDLFGELLGASDASGADDLQARCDGLAAALAARLPTQDVLLVLARTRVLGADRTASWTLPNAPESVSRARRLATGRLASWGLGGELAENTALVVSELVTNVVRYAEGPVRLGLVLADTLFCEVSDDSSTAPHLRRALDQDENGRGLFITAQLTQRWGVRRDGRGKTIWTEQRITPEDRSG